MTLKIKKITLVSMITGVAPGAIYNPTIDLLYDDQEDTTVHLAVVNAQLAMMTRKIPAVTFEDKAVRVA